MVLDALVLLCSFMVRVSSHRGIVMSRKLFDNFGSKIYWDRQLKLIRLLESIMGCAENILWTKEISCTMRKYVRMKEKWNKYGKRD
jgi:hypothetical protein